MPIECQRSTAGGKGNRGKFFERNGRVCAAGIPTAQADETVAAALQYYLLKDEVDSLISDAIVPPKPRPTKLPRLFTPLQRDQRNAGLESELRSLVNPPNKTKFQTIVDDAKDTPYRSYWKAPLGQVSDPVPMFPEGYDINGTTYGKKLKSDGRLYDIVIPLNPVPEQVHPSKVAGSQTCRNYCKPAFNPNMIFGHKSHVDPRGIYAKCVLTDPRIMDGTGNRLHVNFIHAEFLERTRPVLGTVLTPNNNITSVAPGHSFGKSSQEQIGNLPECLTTFEHNPGRTKFENCLEHLNSLRKVMSTRFLPTFFRYLYLNLKYLDKEKVGWLPKNDVYNFCATKLIRFNPAFIEPLLCMWDAFNGSCVEYKTFVHILNFKEPLPNLPKVEDIDPESLDFRTTYGEMVKPGQESDGRLQAGIPSGRYFDKDYPITPNFCCRAIRACLPQESDANACLKPSILTLHHVNHRDMYGKREPHVVRRVFEAAGEKFTDERFSQVWEEAKKYHSLGWVCYETFRKALEIISNSETK